jgi:iron(III) transport system substrate-binding protein
MFLTGCFPFLFGPPPTPTAPPRDLRGQTLVIYSGRRESAIRPMVEAFQAATGVRVDLVVERTAELGQRLLAEKAQPVADIFIAGTGSEAELLARQGLFYPYVSPAAARLPPEYKDNEGMWVGLAGRARVILYNTQLVAAADIPSSVFELTDPRWKGKVAISGFDDRTTVSWVATLVVMRGEAFTRRLVDDLIANGMAVLPTSTDVRQKVAAGEYALGLTNSPAYWMQRQEGAPVAFVYPDQREGGIGTPVTISAVSIVSGSQHLEAAQAFVDYALSVEATRLLVGPPNYELALFPLENAPAGTVEDFRATPVRVEQLADVEARVLALFSPPF